MTSIEIGFVVAFASSTGVVPVKLCGVEPFRPNLLAAAPNTPPVTAPTAVAFAAPLALQPSVLGGQGVSRRRRARPRLYRFRGWRLKRWKRRHSTTRARIRCLGETAMATLGGWRLYAVERHRSHRVSVAFSEKTSSEDRSWR
ncbi:hypothetical protein AB0N06_35260 [Streptomyces sp. NPDC051020]|uniref:hypothetical protein n=1 Tax=Streptomyces sp. NPDC051020 TaxID=3155409 RepID=UPI00343E6AB2